MHYTYLLKSKKIREKRVRLLPPKLKSGAGFSIIEFLMYITILAIAIAAMGLVLSNIFRVGARTDVIQEVSHNGRFALERMGQVIREASEVNIKEGGKELELSFEDRNPLVLYVFEKNDRKKLRIREEDKETDLTTDKVNVDGLFFKKIVVSDESVKSVRVEMNISFYNPQKLPEYRFNSFFSGSFTLRN